MIIDWSALQIFSLADFLQKSKWQSFARYLKSRIGPNFELNLFYSYFSCSIPKVLPIVVVYLTSYDIKIVVCILISLIPKLLRFYFPFVFRVGKFFVHRKRTHQIRSVFGGDNSVLNETSSVKYVTIFRFPTNVLNEHQDMMKMNELGTNLNFLQRFELSSLLSTYGLIFVLFRYECRSKLLTVEGEFGKIWYECRILLIS